MDARNDHFFQPMSLLKLPLSELPQVRIQIDHLCSHSNANLLQIVFTLRAVQQPSSIPVNLASLHLMQRTSGMFISSVRTLVQNTGNISEYLSALRKLYEAGNIVNQVADGAVPFPQNEQLIRDGISLEFRYFERRWFFPVMLIQHPQRCLVPISWKRGICLTQYFFQGRARSALCMFALTIYLPNEVALFPCPNRSSLVQTDPGRAQF